MLIIHGDNPVGSRELLNQKISEFKQKGFKDVVRLDGKKISQSDLIQSVESQSLFGTDRVIVIENLFIRPKSKDKAEIISYLKNLKDSNLIIWETKKLTPSQIKPFKFATNQEFKNPSTIFSFLDSLGSSQQQLITSYLKAIKDNTPESIFYMLSRQIRLIIQTQDPDMKIAPWQKNKLISQFNALGIEKLLKIHHQLVQIDEKIKTGQSPLGLEGELELLISKM
jgi:DNA polymerase III delta subunit